MLRSLVGSEMCIRDRDRMVQAETPDDCPLAGAFIAFPSQKDSAWNDRWAGRSVCEVLSPVKYEWFSHWEETRIHSRGKDYEALKDKLAGKMLEELYRYFPQCKGKVAFWELGTPLSNNFYYGTKDGEVYGLDHSRSRFAPEMQKMLRPGTEVPGLYLSGQDTMINGIMGAMMSGVVTVAAISKVALVKNVWRARGAKHMIEE
eukprot:TRINITY_DN14925_c0_g1_i2.p1 TRINITY_DN14925_c0_g1~~TRINITY_DN14925_c0_g1_i2.p1  ORF type:complete len:203 (-),score=43.97 TRINITY_DN14925_c0_g1_i2:387-995(-)